MNRIKLALAAAIVALTVSAQMNGQEKIVTFGVKAGINLSTFGGDLNDTKSTLRYQVGVTTDIAITRNLYILTGLDLQIKGAKYESTSGSDIKCNPLYLQVPANIAYKFNLAPNTRFVVNAGPYVAYGIAGKIKGGGENHNFFGDNKFNRLDYGVGGGVALEFSQFCVSGGYDFGLKNISDIEDIKVKNRNVYLTLGIKF